MRLFAVSQPGIEKVTAKELLELGIEGKVVSGGVEFEGALRELYLTNLWLRSASRVLVRLCTFKAKHFAELVRKASKCNWSNYLKEDLPVKIRVTSKCSKLYHTKAIEERIWRSIENSLGFKLPETKFEDEGTSIIVRFKNDICTISINSSGAMLHKRGYRIAETEAPIRENLAAALVLISGWSGETPLIDPFCGSGTIPIEAALIRANIPPGINRKFAFMEWKNFNDKAWNEIISEARLQLKEPEVPILGFDIDPRAVEAASKNAEAARVNNFTEFKNLSFPELPFSEATVVTNPPYGERLPFKGLRQLYATFGDWVERNFDRYRVIFITPRRALAEATGLQPQLIDTTFNGGIRVGIYRAEKGY